MGSAAPHGVHGALRHPGARLPRRRRPVRGRQRHAHPVARRIRAGDPGTRAAVGLAAPPDRRATRGAADGADAAPAHEHGPVTAARGASRRVDPGRSSHDGGGDTAVPDCRRQSGRRAPPDRRDPTRGPYRRAAPLDTRHTVELGQRTELERGAQLGRNVSADVRDGPYLDAVVGHDLQEGVVDQLARHRHRHGTAAHDLALLAFVRMATSVGAEIHVSTRSAERDRRSPPPPTIATNASAAQAARDSSRPSRRAPRHRASASRSSRLTNAIPTTGVGHPRTGPSPARHANA